MDNFPSGTVTFLFTDIEGSTNLWEQHPAAMQAALAEHDSILKEAIEANNGYIVKTTGDGVHAVFATAVDAIHTAISSQHNLQSQITNLPIKVRMGLHTGEAELRDGDYYGQTLNRAARIMGIAYGGQILLSDMTAGLAREHLPDGSALLDLGEQRLKGLSRAERLSQLIAPGLPTDFPALKSLNHFPNNLPVQLTSFIGRERELAQAKQRLESAHLLTLIGPGGTGKTRLSLELGVSLVQDFKDGVWLAELASLSDPSLVLQTVASALNVREQAQMSLKEQVLNYLRDKRLLLILDNCEHIIETCAQLAEEFLHNAPNMKIIASSREALGIHGETIYRVPSLSLPEQDRVTLGQALGYESVQLFVERASAANPRFHLTDENASSIAQICHRLDGIPLAIELAASRVSVFSPEQIAARLGDRFKLLTGGSRTALPRQQTLRALIDWSYDILTPEEQRLFRRLSVFSGGFRFEAAEAVCGETDFLDLLTQLVNKSLVVVEEGDETRYHLLETIRQYARDKLLESGEGQDLRNNHLHYFLELAESAEPNLQGAQSLLWAIRLRAEYDNIRAALEWALSEDMDAALRMVGVLPYFWIMQGFAVEGRRWASDVLQKAASLHDQEGNLDDRQLAIRATAWLALTIMATDLGDNQAVLETASQSASLARKSGEKRILSFALAYQGAGCANLGMDDEAIKLAQEALEVAQESGNEYALGFSLATMGEVLALAKQDYENARAYSKEAIALTEKGGYRWGKSMIVFGLGFMARSLGDFDQARSHFKASLPVFMEIGDKHRVNMVQSELAHLERFQGHYHQAIPIYRETILEWQRLGHRAAIAHQLECFAYIAKAQEQVERALQFYGAAEALRETINIAMTQQERDEYEREVADLKANVDNITFDACWATGRAMTMEQAIQYAFYAGTERSVGR